MRVYVNELILCGENNNLQSCYPKLVALSQFYDEDYSAEQAICAFQMLKAIARILRKQNAGTVMLQKQCHHDVTRPITRQVEEIRIPVPWGHIAGDSYIKM